MTSLDAPQLITVNRVRTKICGVRSVADARAAAAAGADAVGLVFAAASKRRITAAQGAEIAAALPPFVSRVALFMDNDPDEIARILATVAIDVIQFHGAESADFCNAFDRPYIKAVPMGEPGVKLTDWAERHPRATAFLLDANRVGEAGGQGRAFDWQATVAAIDRPIVIAGGLTPGNVGAAIARFAPYAVDVSSGVESEPGVKCSERMRVFVNTVTEMGKA
ncbi:phosphoribosylanthranilate isomerase [Salinisphaera sp. LB1]|uniref:phosphoribosylanthranilate isomerase n=1 Tax=Salinisphaera sp. LB1 TaxID=2183911 RepID=UPI000D708D8C|nr:phosphoribosylanthranilate isomerase [Salinisphaera sp. LB1]AWN17450.1 Phosphoribosylanthranilate isomerase [Salinisphaera sp. LB1]